MVKPKWLEAEDEFEAFIKSKGKKAYAYPFFDTRKAKSSGGSERVFTQSRPSDFLVTDNGKVYFAEVKSSDNPTSFAFAAIRPQQWISAIQVSAAGGDYRFYIRSEQLKLWFMVPAQIFIALQKQGFKSVKWND